MSKKTIALDFDGVLHSYTSGWKGPEMVPDPPVEGMADACHKLQAAGFDLVVMSSRARYPEGDQESAAMFVIHAKETLIAHLETHYTPTPQA